MKKNVLIVTYCLGYGGVEVALVNMLKNIDYNKYSVDLLVIEENNIYSKDIPKEVNIIVKKYMILKEQFLLQLKKCKFLKALELLKIYILKDYQKERKELIESIKVDNQNIYDYAIAYHANFQVQYVYELTNVKKKIMYVHSNPFSYLEETKNYLDIYEQFDLICCVSKKVKENLIQLDEKLDSNIVIMKNIIDIEKIRKLSEEGNTFSDQYSGIKILTVGRFGPEKGYNLAIETLKRLIDNKYNVKWYIIGDGNCREQIESLIKQYKLENYCVLLGAMKNPYTYMKDCDIYVQPSLDESYCITTLEAKIFNLPIVRTNTPGAQEQFENMKNGIITDISVNGLYNGIIKYIEDEEFKNSVIENLRKENKKSNCIDQIARIEELLQGKDRGNEAHTNY